MKRRQKQMEAKDQIKHLENWWQLHDKKEISEYFAKHDIFFTNVTY